MSRRVFSLVVGAAVVLAAFGARVYAETGAEGWLRYAPPPGPSRYEAVPGSIVALGSAPEELSAAAELSRGLSQMLSRKEALSSLSAGGYSVVIGTVEEFRLAKLAGPPSDRLAKDAFRIYFSGQQLQIQGGSPQGVLYGAFRLLSLIAQGEPVSGVLEEAPSSAIRWVDQWDNLDGSIERGYAGRSIFFDNGHVRGDLFRAGEYARLLASVGINGVAVNNVNSDLRTLTPEMIAEIARIADVFLSSDSREHRRQNRLCSSLHWHSEWH